MEQTTRFIGCRPYVGGEEQKYYKKIAITIYFFDLLFTLEVIWHVTTFNLVVNFGSRVKHVNEN
jgi:hypothetical protein